MMAMLRLPVPLTKKFGTRENLYIWTGILSHYSIPHRTFMPSIDKVCASIAYSLTRSPYYADWFSEIRAAILEGDVDKALKYTTTYYPHVLERDENKDIYFKLRCRKFIEMMCRVNDLQTTDPTPIAPKAVGKLPQKMTESNGASFDQQMELDDQLHRESHAPIIPPMPVPSPFNPEIRFGDLSKDDRMDEAPDSFRPSHSTNSESLLFDALEFGQELKEEFSSDPRPAVRKALDDTFALIAYQDARESIVGGLMEGKGRVEIAEEVNSAILGK